ncbi:hypothetical protein PGTUg99_011689 [Puccinia graminis f. sp. tritici]|uniref:Uncharacterized protein n=1 Tax=Puccinia graminis f. sp. tritici TaxID=56615 RepID=A0A5B0LWW8_PUCGR|nr:hypothetical protein PGTUg99_011689 [Puccinia graminis f. sp. tritici]
MSYVILGKRVLNEHLAVGTLAVFGTGVALAMRGGSKTDKSQIPAPVVNSSSKDEEAFIREFVRVLFFFLFLSFIFSPRW